MAVKPPQHHSIEPVPRFRPLDPEELLDPAPADTWRGEPRSWSPAQTPAAWRACPECGAEDDASARYCRQCGLSFLCAEGLALEAEPAPEPRRRPGLVLTLSSVAAAGLVAAIGAFYLGDRGLRPAPPAPVVGSALSLAAVAGPVAAAPKSDAPATDAEAPAPPPARSRASRMIEDPVWVRKPSARDVYEYYPIRAERLRQEGRTTLDCAVARDGRMRGCRVVQEAPRDMGFGRASLELARQLRIRSTSGSGKAVAGRRLQIPMQWRLTEDR